MDSYVRLEDAWSTVWPLVGADGLDIELLVAGLDSIRIRNGRCQRFLHSGTTAVAIGASESGVATLTIFARMIPYVVVLVEGDETGWFVRRLAVRSSIFRILEAPCRRMNLAIVADPAIHQLRWSLTEQIAD
ncbi:MAG: hypothetical protein RL417_1453 [Pseudomonadota bacterium]|jgi:hypothetical protein